jgi:hypothetical protein
MRHNDSQLHGFHGVGQHDDRLDTASTAPTTATTAFDADVRGERVHGGWRSFRTDRIDPNHPRRPHGYMEEALIALDNPTIQSLALLGVAMMSAWTAHKASQAETKISVVNKTVDAVHVLSNSAMAAQLKMNVQLARSNAVMAHRLATITKEPGDEAAAIAVDVQVIEHERILQEHLIQQAKVDSQQAAEKEVN